MYAGVTLFFVLLGFVVLLLDVPSLAALRVLVRELWTKQMDEAGTDPDASHETPKANRETPLRR